MIKINLLIPIITFTFSFISAYAIKFEPGICPKSENGSYDTELIQMSCNIDLIECCIIPAGSIFDGQWIISPLTFLGPAGF